MTLRYVKTKDQSADIFTKASFSAPQWSHLCGLIGLHPKFKSISPKQSKMANMIISIGGSSASSSHFGAKDPGGYNGEPKWRTSIS